MSLTPRAILPGVIALGALAGVMAWTIVDAEDRTTCLPVTGVLLTGRSVSGTPPPSALTGRLLVANQFSDDATLIDLATGEVTSIDTGTEPHDAAISRDGRWGVVSNFGPGSADNFQGNRLFVIDLTTRQVARVIETGEHRGLHDVAFRPGYPARVLVTAQTSRHLLEVDVITGAVVQAIETRGDRSHLVAVTPDGRTAFTTNEGSGTVSRLDLGSGRFLGSFLATPDVEGIAVTRDGGELWIGEQEVGAVTVRNAVTGATLAKFPGFLHPNRMVLTPDGSRVIISDPGCAVIAVGDVATRKLVKVIRSRDDLLIVGDVAPDSRIAFASSSRRVIWGHVKLIDLETESVVGSHRAGRHPDGLGWGPMPVPPSP
jgi:DNA-binding beta-propeller fold protein YncE